MKTIEIIISASGESRVQSRGFAGNGCLEASRFLETALGQKKAESLTAEFYLVPVERQGHVEQKT